jgi:RNA polymerase sigma-70 factor (ECF subfamily)
LGTKAVSHETGASGAWNARDEAPLLAALRRHEESAFTSLVDAHSSWMLRTARAFVGSRAVAEEVVQETWLAALRSLDRFEGRSSLRTWLFTIVVNAARRQASREDRSTSLSELLSREAEAREAEPLADQFFDGMHARWPHCWTTVVPAWDGMPEEQLFAAETRRAIEQAVSALPRAQRLVFSLRDLEGWPADEVCAALDVSASNQRVLLHRARLQVRGALERYFDVAGRA